MVDLVDIFEKLSAGLMKYVVKYDGTILSAQPIDVIEVSVTKIGSVVARWFENEYDTSLECAVVGKVESAGTDSITGVFSSDASAVNAAKAEYITCLTDRRSSLLRELNEVENKLKEAGNAA